MTKYEQIYQFLLDELHSGKYRKGDRFLTEQEVAKAKGVNHLTARQAFKLLTTAGYVLRKRGKGTFVISLSPAPNRNQAHKRATRPLSYFFSAKHASAKEYNRLFSPFKQRNPQVRFTVKRKPRDIIHTLREADNRIFLFEFNDAIKYLDRHLLASFNFVTDLFGLLQDLDSSRVLHGHDAESHHVYGIPLRHVTRLGVINTSLADKFGLKISPPPKTWSQLSQWCEDARRSGCEVPLAPLASGSRVAGLLFAQYHSLALHLHDDAGENPLLRQEPFLATMEFFRNLFRQYSGRPTRKGQLNGLLQGDYLLELFVGPWFPYEHRLHKVRFHYQTLDCLLPCERAISLAYAGTSWLGMFAQGGRLNSSEETAVADLVRLACTKQFQEQVYDWQFPCLSPHRQVEVEHIAADPDCKSFYHGNFHPLNSHQVPAYRNWRKSAFEIEEFFTGRLTADELWDRVSWIQRRVEIHEREEVLF